jgi:ABC-2 type transport system ATP-binding protein
VTRSISVEHLSKWYRPGALVLDDLTFHAEGSGAIGYLGPNGAGKTTTLKLLVGLLIPSEGRARLNGWDPAVDRRRALADVGAVIENPEPYPSETIFDALERVGQLRGLDADGIDGEIDRCHAHLHLPPLERRCGGLSKGERQRVVLAAACIGDPGVLLLDEPTNGMDPGERAEVRRFLIELKRDHLILMSSHLITDVAEICDRVMFIDHGSILVEESVENVTRRIRNRAMDVEFARPAGLDALGPLAPWVQSTARLSDRKFRFTFDGTEESRSHLIEACIGIAPLASCAPAVPALEEAYREIMDGASRAARDQGHG